MNWTSWKLRTSHLQKTLLREAKQATNCGEKVANHIAEKTVSRIYKNSQNSIKRRPKNPKWRKIGIYILSKNIHRRQINKKMLNIITSSVIREMQIKTTRYHCVPTITYTIKKTDHTKGWQGCGETGSLRHHRWEYKMVKPLWKTVWKTFKQF